MGLTIKELVRIGGQLLKSGGVENADNDAEALLGFEVGFDKQKMFMNRTYEVDDARSDAYFDLVNRRAAGEPLQYITGEQYFMGHRFGVDPSALIPRPETEALAEMAIAFLNAQAGAKTALDLCTGSGALAVSVAKACPRARITASDISTQALYVAIRNARDLDVFGRIDFVESDLFASIKSGAFGKKFDLIMTNPPYIRTGDLAGLQREIACHEPAAALDGGADGLDFYRRIAARARAYMRDEGCIIMEIGHDQARDVSAVFEAEGFKIAEVAQDLAGLDRIVTAF